MTPSIQRQQGESVLDYKYRICRDKDFLGLETWQQVADVLNKEFEQNWSESTYRKWYVNFVAGLEYGKSKLGNNEYLQEMRDQTLELKKERIKLQSEKVEYNKMLREDSRSELIEEKILDAINNRPMIKVPEIIIKSNNVKNDYIFPIADIHYGANFEIHGWFDEIINAYSPEIAQKRMWDLLEHFVQFNDKEKINHTHLVNLGDSLDGILRMGQLQWIKLGNVDSAIEFAEFLSQWINQLSKYVNVDYYAVVGNHTELRLLDGKRGTFPDENMEKVISHIVWCNLKNNKNVNVNQCKTHMYFDVLGTNVLAVHGHQEKSIDKSVYTNSKLYGYPVDLQLSGHLHHSHERTVGKNGNKDVKYIQCPSIIGVDPFSMDVIKESSNAGAKLIVMREGQGETVHNIILN